MVSASRYAHALCLCLSFSHLKEWTEIKKFIHSHMIYFIKKQCRITNARAWIMHHSRILPGEIIIEGYFRALKDELKIKNWKWANHRIKRLLSLPGGRLQKPRSTCSKAPEENCHLGKVTLIKCLGCFCSQLSSQGLQQCLVYHSRSALYICHTQKITRCVTNEQAAL